ncbi:MAG: type II toxin-antitoxin system prevent-host-death family antitoxin [Gammaproteobacteria bacterium]|nr:type II toxin-antitoxin system prevent-host-death family antitoxin [Gammaproteobacteria bacterium]MCY4219986.1 type II toxin-antitoxin system prevent-host-death family antitoxin [Gammaproteobacteria bacterium]MCY4275390.1 type II toxin-antitoxin system prevent-host-death family antitoxin [Gammaproteobacteria bacterium]
MKEIGISELKAKCIDELKTVQHTGEPLLVTLRKRPIVVINPYAEKFLRNGS